ncbi:peroxiredoxin [Labrys monachus]|uniref:Glutathione-dependent peroxiredoxin n=1 Tax=Labrys monachus TaxID=217067 RepID=A0ABU0FAT4_9HYPH|nr:peroxiredoxin [Labrys monachus]MDQ0391546.1 peroxiredoxin [Labrys monachus]
MTIKPGDKLPDVTFRVVTPDAPAAKTTAEIFGGRKVVLFAVPGAFTPTCHRNHLPGFLEHYDEFRAKGVDAVAVTSVNDVFVMQAWAQATGALGKIEFLADGAGEFAKATGMELDRVAAGLGVRSQRYAMLVEDGVVKALNLDDGGKLDISGADTILKAL